MNCGTQSGIQNVGQEDLYGPTTDTILLLTNNNLSFKICYENVINVALLFDKERKKHTHQVVISRI